MSNPRDVNLDIVGHDKTRDATKSTERNLERLEKKAEEVSRKTGKIGKGSAGLDKLSKSSSTLSDRLGSLAVKGGLVVGSIIGIGAVAVSAAEGITHLMESTLQLGLRGAKASIVFGKQFTKIDEWARKNAESMGLTRLELIGLTSNIQDFLVPMGATRKQAADMSVKFANLSKNLSLWSEGTMSAADITDVFRSALAGEYDSLQNLGININAAKVQTEALSIAKKRGAKAATDLDMAQALLNISTKSSTDSTKLANTEQGRAYLAWLKTKGAVKQVWEEMKLKLAPAVNTIVESVSKNLKPKLVDLSNWLSSPAGKGAIEKFGNAVAKIPEFLADAVTKAQAFITWLKSPDGQRKMKQLTDDLHTLADAARDVASAYGEVKRAFDRTPDAPNVVPGTRPIGGRGVNPSNNGVRRGSGSARNGRQGADLSSAMNWQPGFAAFAAAPSAVSVSSGPVSVDSRVFLDGRVISATARTIVNDSASRQAWRARVGRR